MSKDKKPKWVGTFSLKVMNEKRHARIENTTILNEPGSGSSLTAGIMTGALVATIATQR